MKINKKKFIYLISPNKITNSFYNNLNLVLKTRKVSFFQLRLKNYSLEKKIIIGKKIKNICKKNKVKFIINDDPLLALNLEADGCHLGQKDMNIKIAKKILGKKIIGITCHNSMNLAKKAIKAKADYIAFGAFNKSKTKKTKHLASVNILNKVILTEDAINFEEYSKKIESGLLWQYIQRGYKINWDYFTSLSGVPIGTDYSRLKTLSDNLSDYERSFIPIYVSMADVTGHKFGPHSKEIITGLKKLDLKIKEMVDHNGPVIFDCHVDPSENCFPMIPSGKPHNQMILGPNDKEENKITGKGKALV